MTNISLIDPQVIDLLVAGTDSSELWGDGTALDLIKCLESYGRDWTIEKDEAAASMTVVPVKVDQDAKPYFRPLPSYLEQRAQSSQEWSSIAFAGLSQDGQSKEITAYSKKLLSSGAT